MYRVVENHCALSRLYTVQSATRSYEPLTFLLTKALVLSKAPLQPFIIFHIGNTLCEDVLYKYMITILIGKIFRTTYVHIDF